MPCALLICTRLTEAGGCKSKLRPWNQQSYAPSDSCFALGV